MISESSSLNLDPFRQDRFIGHKFQTHLGRKNQDIIPVYHEDESRSIFLHDQYYQIGMLSPLMIDVMGLCNVYEKRKANSWKLEVKKNK